MPHDPTETTFYDAFFDDDSGEQLSHEALIALRHQRAAQRAEENEARYGALLDDALATFNMTLSPRQFTLYMGELGLQRQWDITQGVADLIVQRMQHEDSLTRIAMRDLYVEYRRYEQMVKHNIAHFEGGSCSTDKARVLLNRIYPAYLLGERNPAPRAEWNLPRVDTHDLWCAVIQSYGQFDVGDHQPFVEHWKHLVHAYQRTAPECQFCGR